MKRTLLNITSFIMVIIFFSSCTTGKYSSTRYYIENKEMLHSITNRYKTLNAERRFSIEFRDKTFQDISFEIISDTFRYIYSFNQEGPALADTLAKFHYAAPEIIGLITDMRAIRCTWINNVDYYENQLRKNLVFVSVRHGKLESLLQGEKYYVLAFFGERQYFDKLNRLTDKTNKTRIREISGNVFRKISDSICYAISGNYR
jgi:hypothetical protein